MSTPRHGSVTSDNPSAAAVADLPVHEAADELEELSMLTAAIAALTIALEGDALIINGGEANVTCAGILTANATVHVIDHVLQPPGDMGCPGDSSVPGSSTPDSSVPMASVPDGSVPGSSVPC